MSVRNAWPGALGCDSPVASDMEEIMHGAGRLRQGAVGETCPDRLQGPERLDRILPGPGNGIQPWPLPPAELRSDVLQDALHGVSVVLHAELVRDGQEQRVRGLDRRVLRKLPH